MSEEEDKNLEEGFTTWILLTFIKQLIDMPTHERNKVIQRQLDEPELDDEAKKSFIELLRKNKVDFTLKDDEEEEEGNEKSSDNSTIPKCFKVKGGLEWTLENPYFNCVAPLLFKNAGKLIIASWDDWYTIRIYDVKSTQFVEHHKTGRVFFPINDQFKERIIRSTMIVKIMCLIIGDKDNAFICGGNRGKLQIWENWKLKNQLFDDPNACDITSLCYIDPSLYKFPSFLKKHKHITFFAGNEHGQLEFWHGTKCVKTIKKYHKSRINCMTIWKGKYLITGSTDKTIKVLDCVTFKCVETLKCKRKITGHNFEFNPKINSLYATFNDGSVFEFTITDQGKIKDIRYFSIKSKSNERGVYIQLSPNYKYLFSATEEHLYVWYLKENTMVQKCDGHFKTLMILKDFLLAFCKVNHTLIWFKMSPQMIEEGFNKEDKKIMDNYMKNYVRSKHNGIGRYEGWELISNDDPFENIIKRNGYSSVKTYFSDKKYHLMH